MPKKQTEMLGAIGFVTIDPIDPSTYGLLLITTYLLIVAYVWVLSLS